MINRKKKNTRLIRRKKMYKVFYVTELRLVSSQLDNYKG